MDSRDTEDGNIGFVNGIGSPNNDNDFISDKLIETITSYQYDNIVMMLMVVTVKVIVIVGRKRPMALLVMGVMLLWRNCGNFRVFRSSDNS